MARDPFFDKLQGWSKRKHRLLGKYLLPFIAKAGSRTGIIYCVDGFAGPGKYADGSSGSPLLIARAADTCAAWSKPRELKIINVESKRAHFKSLSGETEEWVRRGIVKNKRGEFGDLVPEIMNEVGEIPAIFFIDPYGPSDVHFSYLKPILERKQPITELLINFDLDGLRRMADVLPAQHEDAIVRKACAKTVDNVTSILDSSRWKEFFTAARANPADREWVLLSEYMNKLASYGYEVVAYPIRESLKTAPKYYLIYCTRHRDGLGLMNCFMREEDDYLIAESSQAGAQAPLFNALDLAIEQRRLRLRDLILEYGRRMKKTTRKAIRQHIVAARFGEFHDKDFGAVVYALAAEGLLAPASGKKKFNDDELLNFDFKTERAYGS
jgi:three-Cys-motif partner protein